MELSAALTSEVTLIVIESLAYIQLKRDDYFAIWSLFMLNFVSEMNVKTKIGLLFDGDCYRFNGPTHK